MPGRTQRRRCLVTLGAAGADVAAVSEVHWAGSQFDERVCVAEHAGESADGVVQVLTQPGHGQALNLTRPAAPDDPLQVDVTFSQSWDYSANGPQMDGAVSEFVAAFSNLSKVGDPLGGLVIEQASFSQETFEAVNPRAERLAGA
jgi:hypothetical protein